MRRAGKGRLAAALFICALMQGNASAGSLVISLADTGERLASLDIGDGGQWCVLWKHSVQGFEVADCYVNRGGQMVLMRSHLPDFAAGLDHIPGRGRQVSDGMGGYWIEDIDEPVAGNAYVLRPGRAGKVDHRISATTGEVALSRIAERRRVLIALEPAEGEGE